MFFWALCQVISASWCFPFGWWKSSRRCSNIDRSKCMSSKSLSKLLSSLQFALVFTLNYNNNASSNYIFSVVILSTRWWCWDISLQDNVFIISNPKSKYPVLQLDLRLYFCYILLVFSFDAIKVVFETTFWLFKNVFCRLISDLVVVIVSATCGGIAFACAGQPVQLLYLFCSYSVNFHS